MRTLATPRKGMAVLAAVAAVKNLEAQAAANPHSDALKMAVDGAKPIMWVSCMVARIVMLFIFSQMSYLLTNFRRLLKII